MRKLTLSAVAASLALGIAAPASAQFFPVPQYRYQPYNYGYQFSGYGFSRQMLGRVQQIRGDMRSMAARRILSPYEYRDLDKEARAVERRIIKASRNGISPREARTVENRIRRLENRVIREANDWNGRYGRNGYRRY